MLIEGCYNLKEKCLCITEKCVTVTVWFGSNLFTGSCQNLFSQKQFCRLCTCFQNQIIHRHLHVDYNPLQGMFVLIWSLKLSTAPFTAGP